MSESSRSSTSSDTEDEDSLTPMAQIVAKDENEDPAGISSSPQSTPGKKTPSKKTPSKKTPSKTPAKKSPNPGSKTPSSPKVSYVQLVQNAIVAMKDRTGSSQVAIQKYIIANHPEVQADKLRQRLLLTLKTGVANKRFVKVKASYKIHPDAKKKKSKKKKIPPKKPEKKKLTKEQLAAQREKERQEAKEKERLDRIRKRKFPMDDLALIAEDKELKVSVSLPSRPSLPLVMPGFASACRSDTMGSGLLDDAFHIYHFYRGDVGWGLFPQNKDAVAPFTLSQWLECIQQVLRGGAKKARMLPPLMTHLFVVALQRLVPKELGVCLTPASWSEVLMMYMDAMERYYTTEASQDPSAQPGLGIDVDYLFEKTDEHKDESLLDPPTQRSSNFYLQGPLQKIQSKLFLMDPWMLSAEELLALLVILVDDVLAYDADCSNAMEDRLQETYELLKRKREADAYARKLENIRRKEQNAEKEQQESGEKTTRSNSKLPTVSEAQVESARRAQQKANDAYEKACRSQRIRTEAVGKDRNFHAMYHFWNDAERVYMSQRGKALPSQASFKVPGGVDAYRTVWHCIDKRSVVEKYIASLDVRGKREAQLQEALQPAIKTCFDDIKQMNDKKRKLQEKRELQRRFENAKLKCEVGRKSGRLAAQSEQEFFNLQSEIDELERVIAGEAETPKVDLEVATGLEMLRSFDRQDEQNRRRATRRDVKKQEEELEYKIPKLQCSKLWSTGNIDGTGVVGSIVWDLLELEERVERLASGDPASRKTWISNLETAAHSWYAANPPSLEEEPSVSPAKEISENGNDAKKQRRASDANSSSPTASQIVNMMKQPIMELEQRLFEMTGLAMAARDADEADDNMSTSPEEEKKEEDQDQAWKKLIFRLARLPAKAHSKIRHLVVEAIAAARKAQQATVVTQLREALLQFHPDAAGACKSFALEILEQHGGYEEDDEDDDEEETEEMEVEMKDEPKDAPAETSLSTVLSFDAVILNSCLDGQEDARRSDWIGAVKKAKTVSKLGALASALCSKASKKLEKLELEQDALMEAMESWRKASNSRKKTSKEALLEPSEVWTNVEFTDEFCLAKVEQYPWWPAKKCIVKDSELAKSLNELGRTMVALVGESGGLRVVKKESLLPFSESLPEEEDLSQHPKEIRTQLDECMAMARRIIRGKQKKASKTTKKRKSSGFSDNFKEEKKLAT